MSIVTSTPPAAPLPPQRLWTIADVAVLPSELPTGPVRYELDNGRLITMPPPGDIHSAVDSDIHHELKVQGEKRGFGEVRSEGGLILWRNPDRLVGPDSMFIAKASLPVRRSPEGYLETIPDLAVEVRSKNDSQAAIEAKVADYLRAGVKVVWIVDPLKRCVTAYRANKLPELFNENDLLTIPDVIPGFQMPVKNAFAKV